MKRYLVALAGLCTLLPVLAARSGDQPSTPATGDELPVPDGRTKVLERRLLRLTLDLHDGPMQHLAVVGLGLRGLQRQLVSLVAPEHHEKVNASIARVVEELGKVDREMRSLITALEADPGEIPPLVDAIEAELRDFRRLSVKTHVELVLDGTARAETDSQRIALQAVVRAALANVAKHAAAAHVTIRLCGTGDAITLEIEDDGVGFSTAKPIDPSRLGLAGMRKRVELLGGDLRISSRPGGPTTISATLHTWRPPQPPPLGLPLPPASADRRRQPRALERRTGAES